MAANLELLAWRLTQTLCAPCPCPLVAHAQGTNERIIDTLASKTGDVIKKLEMLAEAEENGLLTAATLQDQLSNPALAHFLYSVACAERLAADSASSQTVPREDDGEQAEEAGEPAAEEGEAGEETVSGGEGEARGDEDNAPG